jgi:hypothetical protein
MIEFKKEIYGAEVATIVENEDEILEVLRRSDGKFDLTVHCRRPKTGRWDDLTVVLEPRHFKDLGDIAGQRSKSDGVRVEP